MSTAFIMGAGCSYGTLSKRLQCPPACFFGRELEKQIASWSNEFPELAKAIAHLRPSVSEVSLERIWTCIDYYSKFGEILDSAPFCTPLAANQLKSALLRLYGCSIDAEAQELALSDEFTLAQNLNHVQAGDTVISFNYDTLVERLFCKRPKGPRLLHCTTRASKGDIVRFAKPHGSTSWDRKNLSANPQEFEPSLESLHAALALSGEVDPLLLGAVPIKSELIKEVQVQCLTPAVYEVIKTQWQTVFEAVRDADKVVVLGYSFPKEDEYGNFFFREATARRGNAALVIEFYELHEREAEVACAIRRAFPASAMTIRYCGPVTPADPAMATNPT